MEDVERPPVAGPFGRRRGATPRGTRSRTPSNETMVEYLEGSGLLRSPECIAAFRAIDRAHFWVQDGESVAYLDMPLRHGRLHQSAPHIYASALEMLMPLRPGISFLNVGSGTGYFSSIVSELIGEFAISDGVDIWPETVAFAADNCRQAGKNNIHFTVGNVYQLDVNQGTLYDRIYLGACGSVHSVYLYKLLQVGGILVGPFETGTGQHLRRVVRRSDTRFDVEVISSVRFASLVEPPQSVSSSCLPGRATPTTQREQSRVCQSCAGLPGVPFTFALRELPWTSARHRAYPADRKSVV